MFFSQATFFSISTHRLNTCLVPAKMRLSQLTTEKDRREAERVDRKRLQERQRKERIFDTKSRIFGLDTVSLDEQVAAKQRQKDAESRRDREFEEIERKKAEELAELEREEMEMKRKVEEETNLYRQNCQKKEAAREFDLNDKDQLKKEKPPRVSDSDPWLSVSGAQKFAGEDLSHSERIKAQKEEQRNCLQHQMEEKRRQMAANKLRDRNIFNAIIASANREDERTALDVVRKNELSRENAEFNQRLAKERSTRKLSDRVAEEKDNLAEIYNHLSSDILTENPATATSALGRSRKLQYMYRGMSKGEADSYRQAQLEQQQETIRKINSEKLKEKKLQEMENANYRQNELEHRQQERTLKNDALDRKEENQQLARVQLTEQEALNKELTENQPTEEYFRFNTTSR